MKKYTKTDPTFNEEIMITDVGDPGHADNINAAPMQIFENTLANREEIRTGESKDRTVTFTSGDDDTADQWTDVPKMRSGEKHKSLLWKISTMFKNVRYLYKVLGVADLSEIEDGTVTGVLSALKPYCFSDPVDNLLANVKGRPLDATQGPVIKGPLDAVTNMVSCINPNSKEDVLALINNSVNLFQKSSMIPFRLQTSDKKLGENIANGNYIGLLEHNNGNVTGFLTNHWNPTQRISIAATLYENPQQIFIKFENFEFFYDSITQINSDLAFLNFSGDAILSFYKSHPACKGCFVVGTIATDTPPGTSEGYVSFYRDVSSSRVIVLFYDYSGNHKIFMRSIFGEQWLNEWTQINSLTNEIIVSSKGSYFVQGGSVSVKFSKIGKNVTFDGEFTTGSAVSSDMNAPLFQMPYTAVNQFGGIIVEGSAQRVITYYCNGGMIYTRAALQPNTTYGISGSYIVS